MLSVFLQDVKSDTGFQIMSVARKVSGGVQKLYFCMATGRCGGAKIQFLHSGTAVKPYPGETFRSAECFWEGGRSGIILKVYLQGSGAGPLILKSPSRPEKSGKIRMTHGR